jgi:ribonuclease-3
MESPTDFIERVIGYSFKDRQVAEEALQRVRNKRLAFLGDKAVAVVLVDSWYRSDKSCGMMYSRTTRGIADRY